MKSNIVLSHSPNNRVMKKLNDWIGKWTLGRLHSHILCSSLQYLSFVLCFSLGYLNCSCFMKLDINFKWSRNMDFLCPLLARFHYWRFYVCKVFTEWYSQEILLYIIYIRYESNGNHCEIAWEELYSFFSFLVFENNIF